jgi:cell division initiation protein
MALTPVEIRHLSPPKSFRGYNTGHTDQLLAEIAASFEDVWRERADLADKVEALEADLVRYKELEALLRTTLVSAERAASDLKEQARREADVILAEAHSEARAVKRRALSENERLVLETRMLKEKLRAALERLGFEAEVKGHTLRLSGCPCPLVSPDRPQLVCDLAAAVADGVLSASGSGMRLTRRHHDPARRHCRATLSNAA